MNNISVPYIRNYTDSSLAYLKKGIWLYFLLLIFEGALRKWVFPGFSEALLVVRDPLAIWLIFKAIYSKIWAPNLFVLIMIATSIVGLISALIFGHGNLIVALYGLRITLIHFPLLFIIGNVLNKDDVLQIGKVMLWLTIFMTVLVALQFYTPQSSFWNRGIGGDIEGSGFSGAEGFFRVPGTFSFTNGLAMFYGLSSAYIIYFWFENKLSKNKVLLIASTLALIMAVPLSISRTVLFQLALTTAFGIFISLRSPEIIKNVLLSILLISVLWWFVRDIPMIETATSAFFERFSTANEMEGGIEGVFLDRFLGGMIGALTEENYEFWGVGLGMGSKVGSQLLVGSTESYLVSEGEWGRLIGELGILLGLIMILIRISLVVHFLKIAWNQIRHHNTLAWMLLSFGSILILQGQWSQPTSLGFAILTGGLILAAVDTE